MDRQRDENVFPRGMSVSPVLLSYTKTSHAWKLSTYYNT